MRITNYMITGCLALGLSACGSSEVPRGMTGEQARAKMMELCGPWETRTVACMQLHDELKVRALDHEELPPDHYYIEPSRMREIQAEADYDRYSWHARYNYYPNSGSYYYTKPRY